jgi:TnpA family transposase
MASIERTAYPRFRSTFTPAELHDVYTPNLSEVTLARGWARGPSSVLAALVLMKSFQRLGYFPNLDEVPTAIVDHIRGALDVRRDVRAAVTARTLYRHHQAIRGYLGVAAYGPRARHAAAEAVALAAVVKDNPADLINVAIEELVRQRFELPAFSTLDRLTSHIRAMINRRLFRLVRGRLSDADLVGLELLLLVHEPRRRSAYATLKEPAKRPTLKHLHELLDRLEVLLALGDASKFLEGVAPAKIAHFAAEAKALSAGELKEYSPERRYTLLLCLIHRAQVRVRDELAEMAVKRIATIHKRAREEFERLRAHQQEKTEALMTVLRNILGAIDGDMSDLKAGRAVRRLVEQGGGVRRLREDCEAVMAYTSNNHLPLVWRFYRSHRSALFRLARALEFVATSQDRTLVRALDVVLEYEWSRGEWIETDVDLSFASDAWQRLVVASGESAERLVSRRHLEVCVFSYLAAELKSGDVAICGSAEYADYREQLLPLGACAPLVTQYCRDVGLPETAGAFVEQLRDWLTRTAREVDNAFPATGQVTIGEKGEITLKRLERREVSETALALEAAVLERLPEHSLLEVLCNVEHWIGWTRHFGPLSGSDPKLERARERYVLTAFTYGCNLGPAQAARHMGEVVSAYQLSFVNRRHVSGQRLDRALRDVLNAYNKLGLPKLWGEGKRAAADGTKYNLYEENLLSEYHIRYGGYGGIAYHHVADSYVALFSHFIPCGVWEAVYIIEGLLRNTSDIQPDTVHADTQGQSTPVFALSHLLGIKLMPRIRNWKDLVFYRPSRDASYSHIDLLFGEPIDWERIRTHWRDLMQVVLSIRAGKISSPTLLRKLGNYSRKNRLYQAFRELGRVVRTVFLLQYISDRQLREQIQASTNKAEAYNGFAKWFYFGGEGVIAENDPEEQEKRIKYNDLVANAAVFQTAVDMTTALGELASEGYAIKREDIARLSPYVTRTIKRFGDYVIDLEKVPAPLNGELILTATQRKTTAEFKPMDR